LKNLGFELTNYTDEPKSFNDFLAEFSNDKRLIRITRDRSQFILSGGREELVPYDLWRAFDDQEEFTCALLRLLQENV